MMARTSKAPQLYDGRDKQSRSNEKVVSVEKFLRRVSKISTEEEGNFYNSRTLRGV